MQNFVSELIGMPLLTRGGERIGYVKNVQTDKNLRRIRNLECVRDEDEEEFTLSAACIAEWGADALVAARRSAGAKNCPPAPFGIEVFSQGGTRLGAADDFALDGLQITGMVLTDKTFCPVRTLQSVTDVAIVGGEQDSVRRPPTRKPTRKAADAPRAEQRTEAARALPEDFAASRPPAGRADEGQDGAAGPDASPVGGDGGGENRGAAGGRKRAGSNLLTGKVLPEDLTDARGTVLAARGCVVDAAVIRRALRHDKLFALTLLCTRGR